MEQEEILIEFPVVPMALRDGHVGFFWIVEDRNGADLVIGETMPLQNAEIYGDTLTNPNGHYDFWERMKSSRAKSREYRNINERVFQSEYEDWPRGRVVYHIKGQKFSLLADKRLHTIRRLKMLREHFNLPDNHTDYKKDGHYSQINISLLEEW